MEPIAADIVRKIVADLLNMPAGKLPDLTARIIDDLGADSLDLVEIIMLVEEQFDIEFSHAEMENVDKVADLVTVVLSRSTSH